MLGEFVHSLHCSCANIATVTNHLVNKPFRLRATDIVMKLSRTNRRTVEGTE